MKESTDIWFCSYLKHHGYEVVDYTVISSNKGRFFYDMSDEQWKEMKLSFNTSETSKIKLQQISLKDLLH